jgi:hypothetical protein
MALALGATLAAARGTISRHPALAGILLLLFLTLQGWQVREAHRDWVAHLQQVQQVATQMQEILPTVSAGTEIYAHRFVLRPNFTAAAAAVWYGQPGLSGGSLQRLQAKPEATSATYLFDYEDGRLYNLMPSLQEHAETIFLWQEPDATIAAGGYGSGAYTPQQVAGPPGDRRLAIAVQPPAEGWLSLAYTATVPAQSHFQVAAWGERGARFRVRVQDGNGEVETLPLATGGGPAWQAIELPLTRSQGKHVTILLETAQDEGYWSIPRFVRD